MFTNLPIHKKLTVVILGICLGSILIFGIIVNLTLNRNFQNYLTQMQINREKQVVSSLAEMYQESGDWGNLPFEFIWGQSIFFANLRYVTDANGEIVLFFYHGRRLLKPTMLHSLPILVHNQQVGTAFFGQTAIQNLLSRQDRLYRKTIYESIIWSILLTATLSMIIIQIFARKLSAPIIEMNTLARNISNGNLETRVSHLSHDEIGELGQSINHLTDKLALVEDLRKKMTADVAHDLRTPLATIHSHLEGMIDEVIPASPANLESLLEEVERLTNLVNDLQEISLADRSIQKLKRVPIALDTLINDVVKKITPLFANKGVILELGRIEKVEIPSDRGALAKIMDNLLSNALKYTPTGKKVQIDLEDNHDSISMNIIDQGIGISEKDLPFIFERFYRTDQSRNRESGGFGLGLTIVKELVEALGGKITVSSTVGQGSTFSVHLPKVIEI
jgi:signal transduction histidine kinase